jgi:chromatin assembly factor 1 subunit A
MLRYKIH